MFPVQNIGGQARATEPVLMSGTAFPRALAARPPCAFKIAGASGRICEPAWPVAGRTLPYRQHSPAKLKVPCRPWASTAGLDQTPEPPVNCWPGVLRFKLYCLPTLSGAAAGGCSRSVRSNFKVKLF